MDDFLKTHFLPFGYLRRNFLLMRFTQFFILLISIGLYLMCSMISGCGQIGYMTGGAKDTLAPVLESATPAYKSTGVSNRKITFVFDEYIDLNNISSNVLISPFQRTSPQISYNRRTVTVRFKDTLLPNTTYNINFGDAIRDLNEANVLRGFSYVFSTGETIDSMSVAGRVILAETGKIDSTLMVMLYRDSPDSAVKTRKPDYISRINSAGNFRFDNLPEGSFKVYALKDGNGSRTYDSPREIFGFSETAIISAQDPKPILLLAYAEEKDEPSSGSTKKPKEFSYSSTLDRGKLDLLKPLELNFSHPVVSADSVTFELADTLQKLGPIAAVWDSTAEKVKLLYSWQPATDYQLFIPANALRDSLNNYIPGDTLVFKTFAASEYGRVALKFTNIDLKKKPVLQFYTSSVLAFSISLSSDTWRDDMVMPGEYELRILYDENGNGFWDPGNYDDRKQPEQVQTLSGTLSVRADWDNEREVIF